MADPTQGNRDFLKKIVNAVTPENAPYKSSGDDVLTPEARAKIEAEKAAAALPAPLPAEQAAQAPVEFVTPGAPAVPAVRAPGAVAPQIPGSMPIDILSQGPNQEAAVLEKQGKLEAEQYDAYGKESAAIDTQMKKVQSNEQKAFADFEKEDADTKDKIANFTLKPHDLFAGKSTWQKVMGGIGMFLGSITPEGARNVASYIEKEINRDAERQKLEHTLLKEKSGDLQNRYKMKLARFGSDKLALMSLKKDAFMATEIQLKKIEASSKGELARAKASQGIAALMMKQQELNAKMIKEYAKLQDKQDAGAIQGYAGSIKDPVAAREFRTMVAEAPVVKQEIQNLQSINKKFLGGTLSPSLRASATISQNLLIGKLRVAIAGPGTMSEGDRELLKTAIANPTDFFSLGSSNEIKLNKLLKAYQGSLDANALAYGLQKTMPYGARKIE